MGHLSFKSRIMSWLQPVFLQALAIVVKRFRGSGVVCNRLPFLRLQPEFDKPTECLGAAGLIALGGGPAVNIGHQFVG